MLLTFGAVIAALYLGAEIFVPIALAILLSFVLAPGVRLLQSWHLGRALPVMVMTALAFCLIVALSGLIAMQVRDLAADIPRYQSTVKGKADSLRAFADKAGLTRAMDFVSNMSRALDQSRPARETAPEVEGTPNAPPMQVVVQKPAPTPLETLSALLTPLIHPLAITGIVIIFVMFILLQREDLRNRAIRLFGAGDLHRSTAAIDDGARRLSRYLVSQLAVNTAAGTVMGLALWAVGVPSPVLWGILFGCLRFVPYVGAPLAAILPLALAAAVSPGWSVVLWTLGIFVVIETVVGQMVEPFLYGHNTGLSPVAVVLAATFWTALWGPLGLILSTPMTVCLVVLGRHVDQLNFLDVMLGDQPPLSPPELFYQRMLADDPVEASDQAEQCLKTMPLTEYYDKVVLPGLLMAQDDAAADRLDVERQRKIAAAVAEVVNDLGDEDGGTDAKSGAPEAPRTLMEKITGRAAPDADDAGFAAVPDPELDSTWGAPGAVVCIGGRGPLDDAPAIILAQLLKKHGFGAAAASHEMLARARIGELELSRARMLWVCSLDGGSATYHRFLMRRLRRKTPAARIVIPAWWRGAERGDRDAPGDANAESRVTNFTEALAFAVSQTAQHPRAEVESTPLAAVP